MAMTQVTGYALISLVLALLPSVDGHARLWEPPGRSTMWRRGYSTPHNYQDHELYCGGYARQVRLGYKCGVCGDPYDGSRDNEAGGVYATGLITRTYEQGQNVTFQIDLTVNHKGYFEFKICPTNDPRKKETEECFNSYPVLLAGSSESKYPVPPGYGMRNISVTLPQNLTCDFCVLQFRYHAGNNWGVDPDGSACVGCGPQEEFYGCSDIKILPRGSSPPANEEPIRLAPIDTVNTDSSYPREPTTATSSESSGNVNPVYDVDENEATNVLQSPGDSGTNWDNIVCRGVAPYNGHDFWCQVNCQMGFCPETHCKCEQSQHTHSTKSGCRAVGAFASLEGYDAWCRDNCARQFCPSTTCIC